MELRRRGSVWKEQMDYFFLSRRMRSAPGHPSSWTPPSAHAHLGGGRILKARPRRLRQCAQQRTPRPADLGEPRSLSTPHPLIIGWYIFRVLLQVFLECCIYWVGFAFRNPPGTQPIARSEVYLSCGSNQLAAMQPSAQKEKLQLP
uniref:Neuronatin n=1 Tax=Panthera tigris altaica TaxID=74533 RepID=A0A8C9JNQ3_PANTA